MSQCESVRESMGADLWAAVAAAAVLAIVDATGAALRPPGGVGLAALAGLIAVGVPVGALLGAAVLVPRGLLFRAARRGGLAGVALAGALDGVLLFVLGVVEQDPRLLAGANHRAFALLLGVACTAACAALWHWLVRPRPRLAVGLAAAGALAALAFESQLRWNGEVWTRVALGLLFAYGLGRAAAPLLLRLRPRVALGAAIACVPLAFLAWGPLLGASPASRAALYHRSTHVRGWTFTIERAFNLAPAEFFASLRGGGRLQPRPRARALRAVADGADVLLLSLDSLRWDEADGLQRLREELGDHVEFSLATSPAPGTRESLAATIRGRVPHELTIEITPGVRGVTLWRDPSATLGHELARAGYRAVTIATHSTTTDARIGIQSGFETLLVSGHEVRGRFPRRSPFSPMPRAAEEVLPIARRVARETPGPLLLWLHLMETHQPYYWAPGRSGPNDRNAFRRAVRYADGLAADFLRDFRSARRRPLVVAVYGDHGEEFGEHGGAFHANSVHAEQVRVAFFLAAPGLPASRQTAPVSLSSLPATILDLLGRPVPVSMTEPSLAPALAGEGPFPRVVASEMSSEFCTLVGYTSERWRLVRDPVHDLDRLYDVARDPYERRDLAASRPQDLAAMRRLVGQWLEAR